MLPAALFTGMHQLVRRFTTGLEDNLEKDEDFEVDWALVYNFEDIGKIIFSTAHQDRLIKSLYRTFSCY